MQDIRAITIDLDDTLWAIGPVIQRAEASLRRWLEEHVPRVAASHSPSQVAALREQVMADHADKLHDLTFMRREVLSRMGRASGIGDGFVDDAFDAFDVARNRVELYPDVEAALDALAARYTLVAVTNGNARLDRIGIDHWFEHTIAARNVGHAKPHRAVFDAALAACGQEACVTLHVGDHPEHDVHGAKQAGLSAAWVNRSGAEFPDHYRRPDATVGDLQELDRLLKRGGRG